jgi:hypothetical protein
LKESRELFNRPRCITSNNQNTGGYTMNRIKYTLYTLLLGLLICLCVPISALTENEEFELYKQFKLYKTSEHRTENNQKEVYQRFRNKLKNKQQKRFKNNHKKWNYYKELKKIPAIGVGLSMVIPTLGHAYAGEWSRAMPFLITDVFGVYLCSLSVQNVHTYSTKTQQSNSNLEIINKEMFYAGVGLVILTRIIEVFDAHDAVQTYNHKLRKGMGLALKIERDNHVMTGIAVRF